VLRELSIQDFVIVRDLTLQLDQGLTVFTGETGAGKSILVDALGLVLGDRVNSSVVRPGANRALITAVFDSTEATRNWLAENDLETDDDVLILRRAIDSQGKGRAYINGAACTLTQLRTLGELLVDIHGQHAHQSLVKPESQRDFLDDFAGIMELRESVIQHWQHWQQAEQQLQNALTKQAEIRSKQDELGWQIEQLDKLDPKPGEWSSISEEHSRLSNGQALLEGAELALRALDDDESGAQRMVDRALTGLSGLQKHDNRLSDILESLESASIAIKEARSDLARYLDSVDLDPERLVEVESRMRALFDAARRFRCEPEDLSNVHEQLQSELNLLTDSLDIESIKAKIAAHENLYRQVASELHTKRVQAAAKLDKAVTKLIQQLGMPDGRFVIQVDESQPGPYGSDKISFMVASHDGAELAPLSKVASGGELSRISLALSVQASQAARVPTLIFDEVDTGVSGAVAEKIGALLRQLGQSLQVLCVTHLAQVASYGHHHCLVEKKKDNAGVFSEASMLNDLDNRVDAIARLLGGANITATTREHAREMLSAPDDQS